MASQGSSLLSSLLGGGVANLLASTVGKFLGIGEGPVKTVMGLLTPVILGVLGNQQRAANLDSNGLARLLSGQKDQIAEAIPSGLSKALKISGLFPSVGTTSSTGTAPPRYANNAGNASHRREHSGRDVALLGLAFARGGRAALVLAAGRTEDGADQDLRADCPEPRAGLDLSGEATRRVGLDWQHTQ